MKRHVTKIFLFISIISFVFSVINCGGNKNPKKLQVEEVELSDLNADSANGPQNGAGQNGGGVVINGEYQEIPASSEDGYHPMFRGMAGVPISMISMGAVDPDPSGHTACDDYDGDGIPNDHEMTSNPYIADYPRIVARISAPITMELRVSETDTTKNHSEVLEDSDMKETISNSMEDKHYTQMNKKTTPYVTKESYEKSRSHSEEYGYTNSDSTNNSTTKSRSYDGNVSIFGCGGGGGYNKSNTKSSGTSSSRSRNQSVSDSFSSSAMSEKTVFEDVDYRDNLDRNGVEFRNDTVQNIAKNYRQSEVSDTTFEIGPNAGIVRAALFLKNLTVNMPVQISNVICTLSFRTPAGEFLPVKTFKLRNEDYSEFNQAVYGGEELGPYTVEITGLNTNEVKKALANGYNPQIHVVSYDMHRVEDSNYNPGVENLKIVEETAKGRTATIKIVGNGIRDIYRVAAFDVDENGNISPGISLKKALYNIFADRIGDGESWTTDREGKALTVSGTGIRWKPWAVDRDTHQFGANKKGNSWRLFETKVKVYTDEYNVNHYIETIKRIGTLEQYNPFNGDDNPSYDPNELLEEEEILKMKYWVILHNGRYFEGDINDPIWAGERFEIVCIDIGDFNSHFENFFYTPLQSKEPVYLDTRWNRLMNTREYDRSVYLGKAIKGDVISLEIDLDETRYLFDPSLVTDRDGNPHGIADRGGTVTGAKGWYDFTYTFQPDDTLPNGIPKQFVHYGSGGVNNIKVSIAESEFAHYYEVGFREKNSGGPLKTVRVSAEDLKYMNGTVIITRNSRDINGNSVGQIPGGTQYEVQVKAKGTAYGVDVVTESGTNGTVDGDANVADPAALPSGFSANVAGLKNYLDVMISEALNTEYYIIRVKGPINYYSEPNIPVTDHIGRPGLNSIAVPNPSGEITDPGVFTVEVYSVNGLCYSGSVLDESKMRLSNEGTVYTTVEFEKYPDQKMFQPAINTHYQDLRAIDLEVNFNDGTGWYRLKLESNDRAARTIDCRYTSYAEYNKQKFFLSFRPPAGGDDTIYDVFAGGREEVDVYIRTVAEDKYRDTFWLKMNGIVTEWTDGMKSIITGPDADFTDFVKEWIALPETDASYIEDTVVDWTTTYPAVISGDTIGLVNDGIGDYFFSPLEQRLYTVQASIVDTMTATNVQQLDSPEYTAAAGYESIEINGISSVNADWFEVFWKPGDSVTFTEDVRQTTWNSAVVQIPGDPEGPVTHTIENLTPNQKYIIAVKGFNQYGESPARFYYDNTDTAELEYTALVPAGGASDVAPQISVSKGADGKSIVVSNLYVAGECRYRVYWKKENETDWNSYDTYINTGELYFHPISYTISDYSNLWGGLNIYAQSYTINDVPGASSEISFQSIHDRIGDISAYTRRTNVSAGCGTGMLSHCWDAYDTWSIVVGTPVDTHELKYDVTYHTSFGNTKNIQRGWQVPQGEYYIFGNTALKDPNKIYGDTYCTGEEITKVEYTIYVRNNNGNEYSQEFVDTSFPIE